MWKGRNKNGPLEMFLEMKFGWRAVRIGNFIGDSRLIYIHVCSIVIYDRITIVFYYLTRIRQQCGVILRTEWLNRFTTHSVECLLNNLSGEHFKIHVITDR